MVFERSDCDGAWQFPQGGMDPGETPEDALRREMFEELGTRAFRILRRSRQPITYEFPADMTSKMTQRWRGQEQIWFALCFDDGQGPRLDLAEDQELKSWRWVRPTQAVRDIVPFKRQAYIQGLMALGFKPLEED